MATKERHLIYSSIEDYDENEMRSAYKEFLSDNDIVEDDYDYFRFVENEIEAHYSDEKDNLSMPCGQIIAIADLGTWRGRISAYKLSNKHNLNAIFAMLGDGDDVEIYVEGNDVKATVRHHDGVNYITFREVRDGRNIKKLTNKIYYQEPISRQMISAYTKCLGDKVKQVYGWK